MRKIHIYNNFNNGDVFFSRQIIDKVHKYFPSEIIIYHHKCTKGILKDISYIEEQDLNQFCIEEKTIFEVNGGDLYINTWYGQGNMKFFQQGGGTTLKTIYLITKNILTYLNFDEIFEENEMIYPIINYPHSFFFKNYRTYKILICNDDSLSGQSKNTNLDFLINTLSLKFPRFIFYVTKKMETFSRNVIFTDDIYLSRPNLLEISYISKHCNIIIGRASGPYSYSMTQENILDKYKTFISLSNDYLTGIWDSRFHKCNYYHLPESNINHITDRITNILFEKLK